MVGDAQLPYVDKADPQSSHSLIRARLMRLPPGSRILDVGAASGTLGRLGVPAGCLLYGLEPNPAWAALARPYYRDVLCSTLENAPDDFLRGYDVVVCADVLEHTPDPEGNLRRLVSLQTGGAMFLISVPNVTNLWVRLHLLCGQFDYADRGILDRTHLRFFTQRSFLAMVKAAGLRVRWIEVTPVPLRLVYPVFETTTWGRCVYDGLAWLTRLFPNILGYQFVAETVKPGDEHERRLQRPVQGRCCTAGV